MQVKRKVGRPPRQIDLAEVVNLARLGLTQREIATALHTDGAWFARWLDRDGHRDMLNRAVRESIVQVLQAQYDAAISGDVASGNAVLRRLEKRRF